MALGASGIRAGRAYVELGVNDKLTRGLRRAQNRLRAFQSGVNRIGITATRVAAVAGGALVTALGVNVVRAASDAQQTLSRFATVFGEDADAASRSAERMAERIGRSALDVKDMMSSFGGILASAGIRGGDAVALSLRAAQRALDIGDIGNMRDTEAARKIRSLLVGETEAIQEYVDIRVAAMERFAEATGMPIETEAQKIRARLAMLEQALGAGVGSAERNAEQFANQWKRLAGELKDLKVAIGTPLMNALTPIVETLAEITAVVTEWAKANPKLAVTIVAVAAGAVLLAAAVAALGFLAFALSSIFTIVIGVLGGVIAMLGAILSPIGLVVAAVAALGAGILHWTGAGGAAIQWLQARFSELKKWVGDVVGGIIAALSSSNIELAAQILWTSLKVVWLKGVATVNRIWENAKNFFVDLWSGAVFGVAEFFVNALATVQKAWVHLIGGVRDLWSGFMGFLERTWARIQGIFTDVDVSAKIAEINQEMAETTTEGARKRAEALSDIEAMRQGRLGILDEQQERERSERDKKMDADIAAAEANLHAARTRLDAAIADAKATKKEEEEKRMAEIPPGASMPRSALLAAAAETVGRRAMDGVTRGTFNPFAAQSLVFGSNAVERTASATEKTAENTERILDEARRGGLTFT